jgi:hypothetical protein
VFVPLAVMVGVVIEHVDSPLYLLQFLTISSVPLSILLLFALNVALTFLDD